MKRLKTLWSPNAASPSKPALRSNPRRPLTIARRGRKTYFAGWVV